VAHAVAGGRAGIARPASPVPTADRVTDLERALRALVRGEVRFTDGDRALYATDASNYRQVPIGVVLPRDPDDIVAALSAARQSDAPVLLRGGGTSLAGQCCNAALVMDCTRYVNRVVEIDAATRRARVEPGAILDRDRSCRCRCMARQASYSNPERRCTASSSPMRGRGPSR
jgi:hypothetical protein